MTVTAHRSAPSTREPLRVVRAAPVGTWWTLGLIGAVGGLLSGLFAIGGGILMVPLLVWLAGLDQRRAAATSLVAIIPAAVVSSTTYLVHGQVDVVAGGFVALGAVVGVAVGSRLLRRLSLPVLRWAFVVFIVVIAARLLLLPTGDPHGTSMSPAAVLGYVAVGLVTGLSSGLFGIGGGIIAVPLLVSFLGVPELTAKGTALLVSLPTSAVGTIANRRSQLVDMRAGLIVGTVAAVASFPATLLALALAPEVSKLLFVALLVAVAVHLSVKERRSTAKGVDGHGA